MTYYKISDETPYYEQLIDCDINVTINGETFEVLGDLYYDDHDRDHFNVQFDYVEVHFDETGIWCASFKDHLFPSFTISQTYTGYVQIQPDLISGGLPHSKLLNLDSYNLQVSNITTSKDMAYKELDEALKSGDYSRIAIQIDSQTAIGIQIDTNSFVTMVSIPSSSGGYIQKFIIFGTNTICYWNGGDTYATIVDRYVPYYDPPKNLRLKSSSNGSKKVFKITVDDSGTLTATEYNE